MRRSWMWMLIITVGSAGLGCRSTSNTSASTGVRWPWSRGTASKADASKNEDVLGSLPASSSKSTAKAIRRSSDDPANWNATKPSVSLRTPRVVGYEGDLR